MSERLYMVTVISHTFVVAVSEDAARREAIRAVKTEDVMDTASFHVRKPERIPEEWHGALPHGGQRAKGRENWTVEQWLAAQTEPAK